ncbi:hypothetical protein NRB_07410 [Novosphingobium sp. 11B]
MVEEFPFVDGEVNGVKGKFMLDTGSSSTVSGLNDRRIPLPAGASAGDGTFGSGQHFAVTLRPRISEIRIGHMSFRDVRNVTSQDGKQLEEITPDFLGWVGFAFWHGYAMKLDYRCRRATFDQRGARALLEGEKLAMVLPYQVRKLANHPIVISHVGDVPFQTPFDTGQYGTLFTDDVTRDRLLAQGHIRRSVTTPNTYDVDVRMPDGRKIVVPSIPINNGVFAAADPLGLAHSNILSLGYAILNQYNTIWDSHGRKLYLLDRSVAPCQTH